MQRFFSNFKSQSVRDNDNNLLWLFQPSEVSHLITIKLSLQRKIWDIPIRELGDLILPGIIKLKNEVRRITIFYRIIECLQQAGLATLLHMIDELAIKLIETEPARRIALNTVRNTSH
ncbi:hypothetical protein Brsp04_04651 [Brucella sp. NBRC 12952]